MAVTYISFKKSVPVGSIVIWFELYYIIAVLIVVLPHQMNFPSLLPQILPHLPQLK